LHNLKKPGNYFQLCCGRKFSTVIAVENFLPLHCEPFFGEATSRLSGQLDRWGIASVAIAASQ
jgi:hypothetical protein